jgi:hypothetical protein
MEGITATVQTNCYGDELTAVAQATTEVKDALIDDAYIIEARTNGGGSKQIVVTLDIATPNAGASEGSLNVTPSVTDFEKFDYSE